MLEASFAVFRGALENVISSLSVSQRTSQPLFRIFVTLPFMARVFLTFTAEACHVADRVICVSGVLAEEVRAQYGIHPAKLTVIYNGINCSKFDGEVDPGAVKQTYGVGVLEPMFLFVGRLQIFALYI